jgi:hypothetical protein
MIAKAFVNKGQEMSTVFICGLFDPGHATESQSIGAPARSIRSCRHVVNRQSRECSRRGAFQKTRYPDSTGASSSQAHRAFLQAARRAWTRCELGGEALNMFCGSISLCVQAITLACDSGCVGLGEHAIALTSDTAILAQASSTARMLGSSSQAGRIQRDSQGSGRKLPSQLQFQLPSDDKSLPASTEQADSGEKKET